MAVWTSSTHACQDSAGEHIQIDMEIYLALRLGHADGMLRTPSPAALDQKVSQQSRTGQQSAQGGGQVPLPLLLLMLGLADA